MKQRVLLDIDGVIANFYQEFARYLNEAHGCSLNLHKEPASYSFDNWGHGVDLVDTGKASNDWILAGGIANIKPFDGAIEFVGKLIDMCDVYIVTARVGDWDHSLPNNVRDQIKNDTRNWLKKYNMPEDKLHFAHKKVDFCKENGIYVVIEDKMSTALDASKSGIDTILINRGYNGSQIDRFRIYRTYSYDEVLDRLVKLNP